MSKANVLQLVEDLAFDLESPSPVEAFYDDLMVDAVRWGITAQAVLIEAVADTATYELPDQAMRLYAVFYDDVLLSEMKLRGLEAVNRQWRDEVGRPRAYTDEADPEEVFTIYPKPNENSEDFVFLFGSPFGRDFPFRAVGAIIGDRRDDLPDWLDMPLALMVLGREYERDSEHADPAFAKACTALGKQLLALVIP